MLNWVLFRYRHAVLRGIVAICFFTPVFGQPVFSTREFFYVGGKYVGPPGKEVMAGQMYVEVWRPEQVRRRYPIVFIHGGGQTATNWMSTEGRVGWADYFLGQGYVVYLLDQPARGRSAWHAETNGPLTMRASESAMEHQDTALELFGSWPGAKTHTQWPGEGKDKGRKGSPTFDAFYASNVESLGSTAEIERLTQAAGNVLLDKIGSAILIVHSQAGPIGWLLGDSRPGAVKGITALEPSGPPFRNSDATGRLDLKEIARPWGLAAVPLTYSPPVKSPEELSPIREEVPDGPHLDLCWKQPDPPRQLPNLKGIPILIVSTEASYHALYDHCTSKYLTQAGVPNTHMRLANVGVHGNAHFSMVERNNLEIAAGIQKWMEAHIR
jgi:pimeloyl-ACP methyl ester carboxylesterase